LIPALSDKNAALAAFFVVCAADIAISVVNAASAAAAFTSTHCISRRFDQAMLSQRHTNSNHADSSACLSQEF
jgi:hypothetical protein